MLGMVSQMDRKEHEPQGFSNDSVCCTQTNFLFGFHLRCLSKLNMKLKDGSLREQFCGLDPVNLDITQLQHR